MARARARRDAVGPHRERARTASRAFDATLGLKRRAADRAARSLRPPAPTLRMLALIYGHARRAEAQGRPRPTPPRAMTETPRTQDRHGASCGRIHVGQLTVIEDDRETVFGSGAPQATVHVHSTRRPGRSSCAAAAAWAASYMDGLWDTPDLTAVIRVAARNVGRIDEVRRRLSPDPRAVPARPRRVHAQHAAAQPQGHRRPLRPRQRAVRADARPHAHVLVRRLRAPRRDARGGLARQARDGVREARPRPARPRARDRHRLGRLRRLRRDHARLQGHHDHDLQGAARRRRAARQRGRRRAPRRPPARRLPRPRAAPTTSSSRSR